MDILAGFGYGVFGGCLAELVGLWELRRQVPAKLPTWLKSPFYWVITLAMMAVGGGLGGIYIQSGASLSPILAVNLGASAPLIAESLLGHSTDSGQNRMD